MIIWTRIRHFQPEEFIHPELLRWEMLERLDAVREAVGFPLKITSSYRDPAHNAAVGGAKNSAHLPASDGMYSGVDIATGALGGAGLFMLVREIYRAGIVRIGIYPKHVHVDIEDRLHQQVMWTGQD